MTQSVIYINYFSDPDPERKQEYLHCLTKNQQLDFIDRIFVFLERDTDINDIKDHSKLEFVNLRRRLEFRDVLAHAAVSLDPGTVMIILNLDIYLEDSDAWKNIDRDFFSIPGPNRALVTKRHNLGVDLVPRKEKKHWKKGGFCDGWVFKTPVDARLLSENTNFCVGGAPGCDQVMMYLMSKYYHTYSWGNKYKIYHYDICRKNGQTVLITNEKTDWRLKNRRHEYAWIPAEQDWDLYLKTGQRPMVNLDSGPMMFDTDND